MSRLFFPVPLLGDLDREVWPADLLPDIYVDTVITRIAMCDFRVVRHPYAYTGNRIAWFMVGDARSSRQCALHLDDPPGAVYILRDNGEPRRDDPFRSPATIPVRAITLGELTREQYHGVRKHLELDFHGNYRLAYPSEIPRISQDAYIN